MNGHDTRLYHVYGYRAASGPFFIAAADSEEQAIQEAATALKSFVKVEVHDVRENRIVLRKP